MIERGAQKAILEDNYEQYRKKADAYRRRGDTREAAAYYRKCADVLEDIAAVESTDRLQEGREELAENLRAVASKLEDHGTGRESGGSTRPEAIEGVEADLDDPGSTRNVDDVAPAERYLSEPPDIDFGDVGGMGELKETLRDKVIDPLERTELYEQYDLGVVNAVLLYGPPGTGKTYVTEALAGELGYDFIEVAATDVTSSLVGEAADNVSDLFEVALENQPCLLFVDEIDGLMPARSGGSRKTQSERQMVNQFLTELTDVRDEDVIVVGATNLPEEVDDAAVSRFQERIEVPPPDASARAAILRVHLRNRPVLAEEIDWEEIKDLTGGYSARDLEIVANNAARAALQEARESGEAEPITQKHLELAVEETDSSLEGADYENYV